MVADFEPSLTERSRATRGHYHQRWSDGDTNMSVGHCRKRGHIRWKCRKQGQIESGMPERLEFYIVKPNAEEPP